MTSKLATDKIARTEELLDVIESAFKSTWNSDANETLPEELRDPLIVMERGKQLLAQGLSFFETATEVDTYEDEFRMAARNGKPIPVGMSSRMHAEREQAEAQMVLTLDEPG